MKYLGAAIIFCASAYLDVNGMGKTADIFFIVAIIVTIASHFGKDGK